jgi:hypothetical protein
MRSGIVVGSLMVAASLAGACPSVAQGLGDAARQERERRDKLKAEGKSGRAVVDADSLKTNKGQVANAAPSTGTVTEAAAPAPPPSASASTEAEPTDTRRQDEAAWRQLLREARANVEKLQQQYDMLSSQHLAAGEYFVDARTGKRLIGSAERLQNMVAQAKAALDAGQRQLEALEERARREHVPPGWLR